jgi:mannose-6-phosphate isomerase-like protein (cupin superfamily)
MSYDGYGEVSASYRPADGLERVTSRATEALLVATGSLTAGRYGLFRWDMKPRAGGPKPHYHRTYSEAFYVLGGTVRVYDGAVWVDAGVGDYLYVPERGIHAFENVSDAAASMLILFAPGAPREAYFRELAAIQLEGRELSADELADLYARHDQTMV